MGVDLEGKQSVYEGLYQYFSQENEKSKTLLLESFYSATKMEPFHSLNIVMLKNKSETNIERYIRRIYLCIKWLLK
jgi:hypothetical protein